MYTSNNGAMSRALTSACSETSDWTGPWLRPDHLTELELQMLPRRDGENPAVGSKVFLKAFPVERKQARRQINPRLGITLSWITCWHAAPSIHMHLMNSRSSTDCQRENANGSLMEKCAGIDLKLQQAKSFQSRNTEAGEEPPVYFSAPNSKLRETNKLQIFHTEHERLI